MGALFACASNISNSKVPTTSVKRSLPSPTLFPSRTIHSRTHRKGQVTMHLPLLRPSNMNTTNVVPSNSKLMPHLRRRRIRSLTSNAPIIINRQISILRYLHKNTLQQKMPSSRDPPRATSFSVSTSTSSRAPVLLVERSSEDYSILAFGGLSTLAESCASRPIFPSVFESVTRQPVPVTSTGLSYRWPWTIGDVLALGIVISSDYF